VAKTTEWDHGSGEDLLSTWLQASALHARVLIDPQLQSLDAAPLTDFFARSPRQGTTCAKLEAQVDAADVLICTSTLASSTTDTAVEQF